MNISFYFRHISCGISIHRVFLTLKAELQKENSVRTVEMPSARSLPWDIIINSWYAYRNRDRKGINHITGHIHDVIIGLRTGKTVLTIHDLVFLDNVKNPIKRVYKWFFWLYLPVKLADKVTCISEKTKRNVLKYINTDKISVIHNPIDPIFEFSPKEFNVDKPIILHIGTGWNKNLSRTILALKGIRCHLRIVGDVNGAITEMLMSNNIDYSNVSGLSDAQIYQEYLLCDIVNFPSEYEGFGMPVIEGQATGRVVLASAIEPLIEISGEAVHFVNPLDLESLKEGYQKLIADSDYRNRLIEAGRKNVRRFQVANIAQAYLSLYKEVLSGKKEVLVVD